MSKKKISFTQLTHDVVQQSSEPLPFDEILKSGERDAPHHHQESQKHDSQRH